MEINNIIAKIDWTVSVPIVISLVALIIAVLTYFNNKRELNLLKATTPLVLTYEQMSSEEESVTIQHSSDEEDLTYVYLYPVKPIIHSSGILQVFPIVSFFSNSNKTLVNVAPALPMNEKEIESNVGADVKLSLGKVPTFIDDGSIYQSFLITGTDNSYHLIMLWYSVKDNKQGFLDSKLALSTLGQTGKNLAPDWARYQYQELKKYLIKNHFDIQ